MEFEPNDSIYSADSTGVDPLLGEYSTSFSAYIGNGYYGDTSGDYDFYSLDAYSGDTITVDTYGTYSNYGTDTFVGLYDSSGTLLASNDDDFGSTADSYLSYGVSSTDQYYVGVWGYGSGAPADPFSSGTGSGVGSIGDYDIYISAG